MISLGTGSSAAARSLRSQALTSGRKGVLGHEVPGQRQAVEGRQGGVHPRGDAVGERQGALHAAQEKGQKEEADAHGDARCEHVVWEGVRLDLHLSRLYTRCSLRAPPPPAPSLPHRRDHAHPGANRVTRGRLRLSCRLSYYDDLTFPTKLLQVLFLSRIRSSSDVIR